MCVCFQRLRRRDVLDGPFHSVLGDRVVKLGKPYREVVVHDNNQIFPEFILYYKRSLFWVLLGQESG